jgi:hypothetical protein
VTSGKSLRPLTPTLSLKGRGGFFSLQSERVLEGWRNSVPSPLREWDRVRGSTGVAALD